MRSWGVHTREDLSEWVHQQGFPRPRWGGHFSGRAQERLLTSAATADPRVGALRMSYVHVALQACRQGCRTEPIVQESVPRTSRRPHRMLDEFTECSWAVFDDVDVPVLFRERFTTLQSCPQCVRGRFRQACRKALEARRDAVNAGDELMEERSWKMFCLLPFFVAPSTCEQVHDHQGSSVQAFRFVRCWCVGHTRRRSSCIHSTGQTDGAKILKHGRSGQSSLPKSEAWGNHAGSSVPHRSSTCSWQ